MKKKLSQLIKHIQVLSVKYITNLEKEHSDPIISSLTFDSRSVKNGSLFFALPGVHVHGNSFIEQSIKAGAVAVIYQDEIPQKAEKILEKNNIPAIQVASARFAMSPIADAFYDFPSTKLGIIGVTGTEGKSSTVSFIHQLLCSAGKKAGFISTVEYSLGKEIFANPEHQTTPESVIIHEKLYQMLLNGCEYAVIESSSHGLSEKTNRLGNVLFDVAIMMNVTHEHLEFHGSYEQYKYDKANLFRNIENHDHLKLIGGIKTPVPSFGIVNLDDKAADYFAGCTAKQVFGFTTKNTSSCLSNVKQINIANIHENSKGLSFEIESLAKISTKLSGSFNAFNITAAVLAVSGILYKNVIDIALFAKKLEGIKGRMTKIKCSQPFEVIVDYAHTPSSFETIFPPIKNRCKGRVICIFGSGGERDTQKRPIQGGIASKYCDIVILADEDPRNEDPLLLLEDIAAGCKDQNGELLKRNERLFIIPDRKKAVRKAFSMAKKNDIVLLLGKSHENSIIYKDFVMPYDEILEAKKALSELGF
ncbi:MAG: UDP-N-acetylmuramoyl-L-alanyl-D-glutamate--2,6-diaminopimelate ligase [Treponemataceae bacterium]